MNDFPKMMYRAGGSEAIHGSNFATHIVNDADEEEAALADGWHLTTPEAIKADKASRVGRGVGQTGNGSDAADDTPPSHAELKQKAAELGLTFAHNTSKVTLTEMIEQELAKG